MPRLSNRTREEIADRLEQSQQGLDFLLDRLLSYGKLNAANTCLDLLEAFVATCEEATNVRQTTRKVRAEKALGGGSIEGEALRDFQDWIVGSFPKR
jgi:hypothetical protein